MDALNLLQQDHRHASLLMSRIKARLRNADSLPRQAFQELTLALDLHARIEELHVYAVFQPPEITKDSAACRRPCGPTHTDAGSIIRTVPLIQGRKEAHDATSDDHGVGRRER